MTKKHFHVFVVLCLSLESWVRVTDDWNTLIFSIFQRIACRTIAMPLLPIVLGSDWYETHTHTHLLGRHLTLAAFFRVIYFSLPNRPSSLSIYFKYSIDLSVYFVRAVVVGFSLSFGYMHDHASFGLLSAECIRLNVFFFEKSHTLDKC